MKIKSNLWFESEERAFFGKGRIELLEQIARCGSISKAAKAMKMSYKAAWDAVNEINSLSKEPIVVKETGGRGGGGTRLTEKGLEYIRIYKELEKLQSRFFDLLAERAEDMDRLGSIGGRLTLQTSARNQFSGTVVKIECTDVECGVELDIGEERPIRALITRKSAENMAIEEGMELFALIKSSWVSIGREPSVDGSLNSLEGRVASLRDDGDFTETELLLKGGRVVVSVTSSVDAAEGLKVGEKGYAVFSPSDIILAR
ncbi:DNA-binding domain of ModE [Hydrogenimonas sp.]|nr:DNA-binding domain of ModE [Hydrogenimonas sp.]